MTNEFRTNKVSNRVQPVNCNKVVTITGKDNKWKMKITDEDGNMIASGKAGDMKTVQAMCEAAQLANTKFHGAGFGLKNTKVYCRGYDLVQSTNDELISDLDIAIANQRKLSREKGTALRELQELKLLVRDLLAAYELIKKTGNVEESVETLNTAIQKLEEHMAHQPKLFDERTMKWQR